MSDNDICSVDVEIQETPGVDAEISEKDHIDVEMQQISEGTGGGGNPYAVLYVEQSLTEGQKAQARENIGAIGGNLGQLAHKDRVGLSEIDQDFEAKLQDIEQDIDDLQVVEGRVETLIGSDEGKSARTIANEELAKQLIAPGADASLDSLTEIAAWIQAHPDDAAAMNAAITALQNQLSGIAAGSGTVKKYVDAAISALKIGEYAKAADLTALAERVVLVEELLDELGALAGKSEVAYSDLSQELQQWLDGLVNGDELEAALDDLQRTIAAVKQTAEAQTDWEQMDESQPDFLKNKPFGEMPTGGDTLYWDGNTDGLLEVTAADRTGTTRTYYKVSDAVPTWGDLLQEEQAAVYCRMKLGAETIAEIDNRDMMVAVVDDCVRALGAGEFTVGEGGKIAGLLRLDDGDICIVFIMEDSFTWGNFIFPEKGTYFSTNVDTLWLRGCTKFPSTKQMDKKYLPMDEITAAVIAALPNAEGVGF